MAVEEITCLALVGLRGTGKTTIGRALATRLGWAFADGDELLASEVEKPAGDYLAAVGEQTFREVEERITCAALDPAVLRATPAVLALGGGAVSSAAVRELLGGANVFVVHLTAPLDVLVERLGAGRGRPPLTNLPLRDEVAALAARRRSLYEQCAVMTLETFPANADSCCGTILAKMAKRR